MIGNKKNIVNGKPIEMRCKLNELRIQKHYCDVTVVVDGDNVRFPCHRVVLASVSDYFHSLFISDLWDEANPETTLKEIDEQTFEMILKFAYLGELNITKENAFALLKSGHFLEMTKFSKMCMDYIEKTTEVSNILDIFLYAICPINDLQFAKKVAQHIAPQFKNIADESEFLNMPFDALNLLLSEFVSYNRSYRYSCDHNERNTYLIPDTGARKTCYFCCTHCEVRMYTKTMLNHLVKWMNHDLIERRQYFGQLARHAKVPDDFIDYWKDMLNGLAEQYSEKMEQHSCMVIGPLSLRPISP